MSHAKGDERSWLLGKYLEGHAYVPYSHSPKDMNIAAKLSQDNQHQQGQPISLANAPREFHFSFFKGEDLLNT
jgi:hypothetical protein